MKIENIVLCPNDRLFKLGTVIEPIVILRSGPATTAVITIYDSSDIKKVTSQDMTRISDRIYHYQWQSPTYRTGALEGYYRAVVEITDSDGFTTIQEIKFEMERYEEKS